MYPQEYSHTRLAEGIRNYLKTVEAERERDNPVGLG
jgi:hypothetical protein